MISALLLAAAVASAAEPVKNPDTFTNLEIGEVGGLDPAYPYDASSQSVIQNVYETLIAFKGSSLSEFEPRISEKIPSVANGLISKDGRTYRFPIRKGVKFHDGSEVTPEDVRWSLLRFMITDRAGGPSGLLLEPIAGIPSTRVSTGTIVLDFAALEKAVRVDKQSVVITLPRPFGPFLGIMARWSYVVSKPWAVAHGDWDGRAETWRDFNDPPKEKSFLYQNMNGAGPFKLVRWDKTARYVLLDRHDAYWRGPAKLKHVVVKAVPELQTRKLMLQAGDADLIETPRPYASQLAGIPGVVLVDGLRRLQTDPALFFTTNINPAGNPDIGSGKLDGNGIPADFFSDADVRRGFSYAFDYDAIMKDTFKGTAARALGPIPPGVAGHDPNQPRYVYDLKKAEAHLRKAWGGKVWETGFKFTLTYNTGSENREAAAQILKKNVEKLNPKFRIDLRGVDWASFLDKSQRRLMPLFARGWLADYPDAHNFIYAFYHSSGRYPSAQGFADPELDKLIEAAAAEPSPARRAAKYKEILRRGFEAAPAVFTVHPAGVYGMRAWVKGFVDNPVNLGIYYYPISKR
ncbi:MAG: ABC transporter substrate-binding protein [Elusimicrobiota bacterium]|nr:MAG: ABC transporter substrate-binding protein [Elusimicrobiota bacterium]